QKPKILGDVKGEKISPNEIVELAVDRKLSSISYTYTEPTVFLEYALDTMKLAKKKGLKNAWVTNGFLSDESIEKIAPYLDAVNIDLKSFSDDFYRKYCQGRLKPVLNTLKRLKKKGVWLEITTLVIPTLNDSENTFKEIAYFIKKELGPKTPWHLTRFAGEISWKLQRLPNTPLKTLKKAWEIAEKAGLKYVYTGNAAGLESEDTFCPKCKEKMIERLGYLVTRYDKSGKCSKCGESLNIIE
ncbi:AmmeMemoRadiSam system radical SAM enzyme, partial [Patescibacteria group bacterium]|nr:AmmeMemoRadiSam system radical SAM enzyme [Patescibacteria group bacterium]